MYSGRRLSLPMPAARDCLLDKIKKTLRSRMLSSTNATLKSKCSNRIVETIDLKFPLFNPSRLVEQDTNVVIGSDNHQQTVRDVNMMKKYEPDDRKPSVTQVLTDTMPAMSVYILNKWKNEMIEKLGKEGFKKYQDATFKRGRDLHLNVANALTKGKYDMTVSSDDQIVINLWQSIKPSIEKITDVVLIEDMVEHPFIGYKGRVDCLASFDGKPAIIDFKTADKAKPLYDYPLQLSAYAGAINFDERVKLSTNIDTSIVIVAYTDGSPATLHTFDAIKHWCKWLERIDQFYRMKSYMKMRDSDTVPRKKRKT